LLEETHVNGSTNRAELRKWLNSALDCLERAFDFLLFQRQQDSLILTTAPALSVFAGFIAIAVIAYESLKMRTVSTRSWAMLALAITAYGISDFVLTDYASGYSILQ
jgi:hypothetical protein